LHLGDFEPIADDDINDFANMDITIGLDHRKGPTAFGFKLLSSGDVSILGYLKLSCVDGNGGADEQFIHAYIRVLASL